jgi:MFS family permease
MARTDQQGVLAGLSRNTVLLALASLFADVATEMLYPVLPIYLTQTLRAGGQAVGLIEGVAEGTQNVVQGFAGSLSDRLQRRKPIALAGYAVAALAKPLIGVSAAWPGVLGARFADRLGTGVRSARATMPARFWGLCSRSCCWSASVSTFAGRSTWR